MSFTDSYSQMHVEFCMGTKDAVKGISNNTISYGVGKHIESIGCDMGAITQEDCDLSLNDL